MRKSDIMLIILIRQKKQKLFGENGLGVAGCGMDAFARYHPCKTVPPFTKNLRPPEFTFAVCVRDMRQPFCFTFPGALGDRALVRL